MEGYIIDFQTVLEHHTFEHFGLGGGLNIFNLNAAVTSSDWRGKMNTSFYGLLIYGKFYL